MKKHLLTLISVLCCHFLLQAQSEILIQPQQKEVLSSSKTIVNSLLEKPENLSAEFVRLDLSKLEAASTFSLQFDEKSYLVSALRFDRKAPQHYSWVAQNQDGDGQIILSRRQDDVQATITRGLETYRLQTLSPGVYVILKIDHGAFLPEKCHSSEPAAAPESPNRQITPNLNQQSPSESKEGMPHKALLPYSCKLRLLVLYTPAAAAEVADIENTINLAIAETNQSFVNSDIFQSVELAYAAETAYTEVDIETDLNRFQTMGDNFMDEVFDLRDAYAADICILLNLDDQYCGLASTIQSVSGDAFCATNVLCATGYFSFAHEIGHLLGCRHDTYVDNSGAPFPYGHGFANPPGGWRTIMAYDNLCSANGTSCIRVLQWSNPNVNFLGTATGTETLENCARVWNEHTGIAQGFREAGQQETITASDLINADYADLIATESLLTSGNITLPTGSEVYLRAGQDIHLMPGFKTEAGATFHAGIQTIFDCGAPPYPNLSSCGSPGNDLTINGSTIEVTVEVTNTGLGSAGSTSIGIYLSANTSISTADYLVAAGSVGSLNPGQSTSVTVSFDAGSLSIPNGEYYVGYLLDYLEEEVESNEGDNACYWNSPKIDQPFVMLPDLISCGLGGNDINIDGNTLYVDVEVQNDGTVTSNGGTLAYYLSDDASFSTADYLIGTDAIGTLNPGQSTIESITVDLSSLSLPDGEYFVGYLLDYLGEVSESDETNNGCYWSNPTVIIPIPALPDLNSCANAGNDLLINGNQLQATSVVTNNGTAAAGAFSVGFYLSTNNFISTGDYLMDSDMVNALNAGASGTASVTVDLSSLSVPPGEYYVGYVVDYLNEVQESDEFDNWCYWVNTTVTMPASDQNNNGNSRNFLASITIGSNQPAPEEEPEEPSPLPSDNWQQPSDISAPVALPDAAVFSLRAFPNPSGGPLTIAFSLSEEGPVSIRLQDVRAKTLATLLHAVPLTAGRHEIPYDAGHLVPGIYLCILKSSSGRLVRKIVIGQ